MPRPSKRTPEPNAIIASAARITTAKRQGVPRTGIGQPWQDEAYNMLDQVGELEFYRLWMANAGSRCTLYLVEEQPDGTEVRDNDPGRQAILDTLFGGETGQAQMLSAMFGHLAIPGETWLVGLVNPSTDPDGPDQWRVLSHAEVRDVGGKWQIDTGDGNPELYDDEEVLVQRIWRPHPRRSVEAHSSVRSALPILRELVGLTQRVAADIDSRLAGAGILLVPTEITFETPADLPEGADPFMAALTEAMVTPLGDRGVAEAVVPLVIRAPATALKELRHVTLATAFDAKTQELRAEAITRLATTVDCPAEVLTGMADVNHWTGWLLDENAIKMHVEPPGGIISHGLTTRYYWPALQGTAETFDPQLRRFKIKLDTSQLRQRPNRSQEAADGHAAFVLNDEAYLRERGFEEGDLLDPKSDEFRRRVLMRLATSGTPEVVVAAMHDLGIDLTPSARPVNPEPGGAAVLTPPPPESESQALEARRNIPTQPQAAAVVAACEPLVTRAVERAWNRAGKRSQGRHRTPLPAEQLDALLAGAWDYVPTSAGLLGVDPEVMRACLDGYTRTLLTIGADHATATLAHALRPILFPPDKG